MAELLTDIVRGRSVDKEIWLEHLDDRQFAIFVMIWLHHTRSSSEVCVDGLPSCSDFVLLIEGYEKYCETKNISGPLRSYVYYYLFYMDKNLEFTGHHAYRKKCCGIIENSIFTTRINHGEAASQDVVENYKKVISSIIDNTWIEILTRLCGT